MQRLINYLPLPQGGAALSAETFDVFFSYNSKDREVVRQVYDSLTKRGVRVWMDDRQIEPGDLWMEELQEIIGRAPAVAVFLGPGFRSPTPQRRQRPQ